MDIKIEIGESELALKQPGEPAQGEAGALVEFAGIVRSSEDGRTILALRYEAYQPMAESEMRRILDDLNEVHPCLRVTVRHRIGVVPVGQAAIYLAVEAAHRAEAFALATAFMDRLKQDVPIWKMEVIV